MGGFYYALSIVAIFVVIRWFIQNDRKKPGEPTTGLLAMRGPENQTKSSSPAAANKTPTQNANEK